MTTWPAPLASVASTPQLYTIDDLAEVLRKDFAEHGINAVVEVNEWDPEVHRGVARVLLGLGDGKVGEPIAHHAQPGPLWPVAGTGNDGTLPDVARALLDDAQRFTALVHDPGSGSGESVASGARRATDQLKRATFAAIRRRLAAPFREPALVKWPKPSQTTDGYPVFTYGSVCTFEIVIGSPILDDAMYQRTVGAAIVQSSIVIDGVTSPSDSFLVETPPS